MKEFLSYMKSTLLAAGQLCSAAKQLCSGAQRLCSAGSASFALCIAAAVLCTACVDNDSVYNINPYHDGDGICISALPMVGEEVPYDSRAVNPMSVDKENMIKQIAIFQFDQEGRLRPLKDPDNSYFIYADFTNDNTRGRYSFSANGFTIVTEKEFKDMEYLHTSTLSPMRTCVIANVKDKTTIESFLMKNETTPRNWSEFQNVKFELPFAGQVDMNDDPTLELGHLLAIYMYGDYNGIVPPEGFTLGLGRVVARMKITFNVPEEDQNHINPEGFYAAVKGMAKEAYFFVNTETEATSGVSDIYQLETGRDNFNLRKNTSAVLQFYCAPQVGAWVDADHCTELLLWYDRDFKNVPEFGPERNAYFASAEMMAKAKHIRLGNNPRAGDYGIVRNSVYSYTVNMRFYGDDFEITFDDTNFVEKGSPLYDKGANTGYDLGEWNNLVIQKNEGTDGDGVKYVSGVDWANNDVAAVGDIVRVYYTLNETKTEGFRQFKTPVGYWEIIPGTVTETLTGANKTQDTDAYFQLSLTDDVYQAICDAGGLIVTGKDITVSRVVIMTRGFITPTPEENHKYKFMLLWQGTDGWDFNRRGDKGNNMELPLNLADEDKIAESDFQIDYFLNRSPNGAISKTFGILEYVIADKDEDNKIYALKQVQDNDNQIPFDFNAAGNVTYTVASTYAGYLLYDSENKKLYPLAPTTTDAKFDVTIPSSVGGTPGFPVDPATVTVNVTIADEFKHILSPKEGDLERITAPTTLNEYLATIPALKATKTYYGKNVNVIDNVDNLLSKLQLNHVECTDGISYNTTTGLITFADGTSGTVYLHFDVASSVTSGDLKTYHYFDLTLPVQIGEVQPWVLQAPFFPIGGINIGTLNWGEEGNVNIAEYDQTSQTITFKKEWGGYGWQGLDGVDLSAYTSIAIEFENPNPTDLTLGLTVNYTDKNNDTSGYKQISTDNTLTCDLNNSKKISNIVFQNNKVGSVKIKSVTLYPEGYTPSNPPTPPTPTSGYKLAMFQLADPANWVGYGTAWAQEGNPLSLNLSTQMGYVDNSLDLYDLLACSWTPHKFEYLLVDDSDNTNVKSFSLKEEGKGYNHSEYESHIKFTFASDISFTKNSEENRIIVGDDGTIYPLENCTSSNPAKLNVNLSSSYAPTESNASDINITSRTVPVNITIDGTFEYTITTQNPITISNDTWLDNNLINSAGTISATKKYDGEIVKTVSELVYNNDFTIDNNQVTCTGDVRFEGGQFKTNGGSGTVTIPLNITTYGNNSDLRTYKFQDLVLVIPVGSGSTPSDPQSEVIWESATPLALSWNNDDSGTAKQNGAITATVGNTIRITITSISQDANIQFKDANNGWETISGWSLNPTETGTYDVVITAENSGIINVLANNNIRIQGQNISISKVELLHTSGSGGNQGGNEPIEGSFDIYSNVQGIQINWSLLNIPRENNWPEVKAGDTIKVEFSSMIGDKAFFFCKINDTNSRLSGYQWITIQDPPTEWSGTIDEELATNLNGDGIGINGSNFLLTKVTIIPASN